MHSLCATVLITLPVFAACRSCFSETLAQSKHPYLKCQRFECPHIWRLDNKAGCCSSNFLHPVRNRHCKWMAANAQLSSATGFCRLDRITWDLLRRSASLMLALVSFVGWAICSYSIRYLDGERARGVTSAGPHS